jgi:hypothetical protein
MGGIRAFRVIRAGMAILAAGYEVEADVMSRAMLELYVHTADAVHDPTGVVAETWLKGERGRGISGRVRKAMPDRPEVYGRLSQAAHGDPRALVGMSRHDEGGPMIEWGPAQTPATARCLVGYSVGARDMAVLVEEAFATRFGEVTALDHVLAERVPGWRPDADWSVFSSS